MTDLHEHKQAIDRALQNSNIDQLTERLKQHPDLALIEREQRLQWLDRIFGQDSPRSFGEFHRQKAS